MKAICPVKGSPIKASVALLLLSALSIHSAVGQNPALPPAPTPLGIPRAGPVNDQPYAAQPILQGGIVVPLFPPGSKYLKAERVREAEKYNMSKDVPGRIGSIVNIPYGPAAVQALGFGGSLCPEGEPRKANHESKRPPRSSHDVQDYS